MDPIKLKELRKMHGMRQQDLADKLHISQQSISRYENGQHYPDLTDFVRIADYFNIPLDNLVGRKWPKEPVSKTYEETAMSYNITENNTALKNGSDKDKIEAIIAAEALHIVSAVRASAILSQDSLDLSVLSPGHAKQMRDIYSTMLAAEGKENK